MSFRNDSQMDATKVSKDEVYEIDMSHDSTMIESSDDTADEVYEFMMMDSSSLTEEPVVAKSEEMDDHVMMNSETQNDGSNAPKEEMYDRAITDREISIRNGTYKSKTVRFNESMNDLEMVDEDEVRHLRLYLKLFFFNAFKWKGESCSFHLVNCVVFLLQILKITLITVQLFQFGFERKSFNSIVNTGHTTLRHILLKNWDPGWETLPYPPARGEFASYNKVDLTDRINAAVRRFYNIEHYANGYFTRLPGDNITATLKLFDLDGFLGNKVNTEDGLSVEESTFPITEGLIETKNVSDNRTIYSFDVDTLFKSYNFSDPITRLLMLTFAFNLHSVRIFEGANEALCLNIEGWITYTDDDNNGQVIVNLETLTTRITCDQLNFRVTDWNLQRSSESLAAAVIVVCIISIIVTGLNVVFGIYVCVLTKRFMKKNFQNYYKPKDLSENDIHWTEYTSFFRLWDVSTFIADVLTMHGTVWLGFRVERETIDVGALDIYTVWLGVGGLLAWFSLLRFLNVHNKFNLLFNTFNRAIYDVSAYILCVGVLFVGFYVCGYVVLGPYHVKFSTPAKASEALLAIVNGDEMYATLNLLEIKKTGDFVIYWFSRIYLWIYIAIFVVLVLNLLVAIFMSAYESIKAYYERKEEDRELGPVERALRKFVESPKTNAFRKSMYDLLSGENELTDEEEALRDTFYSLCRVSESAREIILIRPRTLKAFMEEEEDSKDFNCLCMTCSFLLLSKKNK